MDLYQYIRPTPPKQTEKRGDPRLNQSAEANGQPKRTELSPDAVRLLAQLPARLRLPTLPAAFPHIVNRLAQVWQRPGEFERYMEELLLNSRVDRHGFPLQIVAELTALRECHQSKQQPKKNDPWSTVHVRS
jgi:hypothetical protein